MKCKHCGKENSDMQGLTFNELFQYESDGSISPRETIQVGAVVIPKNSKIPRGMTFGKIDFFKLENATFEVKDDGVWKIIRGFYK